MNRDRLNTAKARKGNYFDFSLLFIIIFLLCFGLVMLYSTSSHSAQLKFNDSTWYLKKQIKATLLGVVAMIVVIIFDYKRVKKFSVIIYIVAFLSVFLVLTPLGISANGARRWINLEFATVQPAEFAKLATIIFLAFILSKTANRVKDFKNLFKMILMVLPVVATVAIVTQNLSSAIIIMGIALIMLFVTSPKYSHFLIAGAVVIVLVGIFILFGDSFRLERVQVWMEPEKYPLKGGYQILQGLYAIGSGGIFGKGLGQSVQKLGYIPEAQNDYIFTIVCEELGLFGAIAVILLFLFMLWRFMVIANNAPDLFGALLVVGVMAHIAIQVVLNIAVVTNAIPNTGVTLPFISYGGTSVVFLLAEMGLVLSVSRSIRSE